MNSLTARQTVFSERGAARPDTHGSKRSTELLTGVERGVDRPSLNSLGGAEGAAGIGCEHAGQWNLERSKHLAAEDRHFAFGQDRRHLEYSK